MSVTTMPTTDNDADTEPPKGKKKKLLIGLLVVVLGAAAAWWFVLKPAPVEAEPEPGEVLALEPIQINLSGGHYLRLGLALQASADAGGHGPLDGSKALDSAIELFSGLPMEEVTQPVQRQRLKEELMHELDERYHGEVLEIYFTDFVTQ